MLADFCNGLAMPLQGGCSQKLSAASARMQNYSNHALYCSRLKNKSLPEEDEHE